MIPRLLTSLATALILTACDQATAPDSFVEVANQGVYSVRINHSGSAAFVGSLHHGGSYWTLNPAERHFDWNHQADSYSSLTSAAFAPGDDYVASADNRTIVLWKVSTGEAVWYWNAPGDIEDIALTENGDLALLAMSDYTATLFDIRDGGIRQRLPHDGIVYDVSLSENGLLGASASDDLTAAVWNMNDGSRVASLKHGNQVKTAQLSPSGRLVFTSALREPGRIWDTSKGETLVELPGGRGHFTAARFSDNEQQLLTGNTSGQIQLWDTATGQELMRWRATAGDNWVGNNVQVEDVGFSDTGIVAAAANGRVYKMTDSHAGGTNR